MKFLTSKIMTEVIAFVDEIDFLAQSCTDSMEKENLEREVKQARYFLTYNEWYIAFEILTGNLHEIGYKMNASLVDKAKNIFLQADPAQSEETLWWLNELKKD